MNIKSINVNSTGKSSFNLKDFKGQNVILFFYPKDSTPGCTQESIEFSQLKAKFLKLNTVVFGVSRDSLKSHEKFQEKFDLTVDLLSDEDESLCQALDVIKEKNMYGKKVLGIERSTFLFDTKGQLVHEWRKVKAAGHAEEVFNFVKDLTNKKD